jgi:hypothetical protein
MLLFVGRSLVEFLASSNAFDKSYFSSIDLSSLGALLLKIQQTICADSDCQFFGTLFLYLQPYFWGWSSSILLNCRNLLAGETTQKYALSIAPITNFHIVANVFLWLSSYLEICKVAFKLKLFIEYLMKSLFTECLMKSIF